MNIIQKSGTSVREKQHLPGHRVPVAVSLVPLGVQPFSTIDSKLTMSRSFFNQQKSCPACPANVPATSADIERLAILHVPHVPVHVPVNP